ncbi:MAG TPA: hypothetical protein VGM77_11135 [Gemmatimonadales bacterium]|jgi:hypothetical protein
MASNPNVNVKLTATDDTKGVVDQIGSHIKSMAVDAAKTFGAIFAVKEIGAFFEAAISKSLDAEKSFQLIGNALRNVGVNAQQAQPAVEALIKNASNLTGFKTEDVQKAFTELLERTGSYDKAQKALIPTLDLAAAKNKDVTDAADLYSRALTGNAKAIQQVAGTQGAAAASNTGILQTVNSLKNAYEGFQISLGRALTSSDGAAESGGMLISFFTSLEKWITENQSTIAAWGSVVSDVLKGLKSAITPLVPVFQAAFYVLTVAALAFGTIFRELGAGVEYVVGSIETYLGNMVGQSSKFFALFGLNVDAVTKKLLDAGKTNIAQSKKDYAQAESDLKTHLANMDKPTAKPTADLKSGKGGTPAKTQAELNADAAANAKNLADEISQWNQLIALRTATAAQLAQLITLRDQLQAKVDKGNLSLKDEATTLKQIADLNKDIATATTDRSKLADASLTPTTISTEHKATTSYKPPESASIDDLTPYGGLTQADAEKLAQMRQDQETGLETLADKTIGAKQAAQDLGDAWLAGFDAIGKGANVYTSLAGIAKNALASIAGQEAKFYEAKALSSLGDALLGNPAGFAAAAEYAAAAAAFAIVGGALSGGGSSGGGSSGGGASPISVAQYQKNAQDASDGKGTVNIIFPANSIFDMSDPRTQSGFVSALQQVDSMNLYNIQFK